MKKFAALGVMLFMSVFITACETGYSSYSDFVNQTKYSGWQYHSVARPLYLIEQNRTGEYWSAGNSQYQANQNAIQLCNQYFRTSDCVTYKEGYQNVYQAKIQRTEDRKENLSIDNINERVDAECAALGFKEVDTSQSSLTDAYTPKSAKKKQGIVANDLAECKLQLFTLYKQEAVEELKIIAAEEQAEMARRQAEAAARQAAAAQQQAYQSQRRNNQQLMNQGMKMLSGGCTLGVNC